jgi:hypothetical protein
VIGGTPGHEIGARQRLVDLYFDWYEAATDTSLNVRSAISQTATWIVEHNVLVGNMLPTLADGTPTRREDIPLVEYDWDPSRLTVTVYETTLGAAMDEATAQSTGVLTLFAEQVRKPAWTGKAPELRKAPIASQRTPLSESRRV